VEPLFTYGIAPPYTVPVQVNNYHLYLTEGGWNADLKPLQGGSYKGNPVLYGGGLAYGNSPASVFYYNPAGTGSSFKGTFPANNFFLFDELQPGPYADHQTVSVMLEAVDDQFQSRVPLGLVTARETFAYTDPPDDDYLILKYTLNNFTRDDVTGLHLGQVLDVDVGSDSGDDIVQYHTATPMVSVSSQTPDVVSGHVVLAGGVSTYRRWRIGQDPWPLGAWYARLSGTMNDPGPSGPMDVRHLLAEGPVAIPAGGSRVAAFALVAGDNPADLNANAAAAKAKWASLPPAAKGPYSTPLVAVSIRPRVLNLAAPGVFGVLFEFKSAAEAAQSNIQGPVGVVCSGARAFRANAVAGNSVRAFFHTDDLDVRLKPGESIVCDGRLDDGTRYFGADNPVLNTAFPPITRLTFDPANDLDPSWSPDGEAIVFASDRNCDPGDPAIWRMDLEAGEASAVQLTPCGAQEPDWSPDGSTIVFGGGSIFTVPADGGDLTPLSGSSGVDWYPQYSPDGTEIVFRREPFPDRQTQIWKMTAAGELAGPAAVPLATEGEWHDHPAWSPDGEQIYFVSVDPRPGGFGIYVIDADTGEPATCVTEHGEGWDHYSEPAPSPDGRTLAFLSNGLIILQDLRSGTHSAILTDPPLTAYPFVNLEYSPDGRRLMFVSGHDIYVAELSGM
jgi:hypothetical protein